MVTHSELHNARKRKFGPKLGEDDGFSKELEIKKQPHSANLNMLSYQTANFGARNKYAEEPQNPIEKIIGSSELLNDSLEKNLKNDESKTSIDKNKMFASMSDLNFVAAATPGIKTAKKLETPDTVKLVEELNPMINQPIFFNQAGLMKIISTEQR